MFRQGVIWLPCHHTVIIYLSYMFSHGNICLRLLLGCHIPAMISSSYMCHTCRLMVSCLTLLPCYHYENCLPCCHHHKHMSVGLCISLHYRHVITKRLSYLMSYHHMSIIIKSLMVFSVVTIIIMTSALHIFLHIQYLIYVPFGRPLVSPLIDIFNGQQWEELGLNVHLMYMYWIGRS